MEVNTIFEVMVKPSNPTPFHLKTKSLSFLDQFSTPFHVPTLLFYYPSHDHHRHHLPDELMMRMKTSLEKALSVFYPLAGRLIDDSTLGCDDEGALLIHTQVKCTLESYILLVRNSFDHSDRHKGLVEKLLPKRESLHGSHEASRPIPISAWLQSAFQVNIFECGGVVLGCYMSHKLMDGTSAGTFLQHWAGLSLGLGPNHLVQPNFDAILSAFPPLNPTTNIVDEQHLDDALQINSTATPTTVTVKSFIFKPTALNAIKEKAASDRILKPTRIESLVGFLWKHCIDAEDTVNPTNLLLTVDMRSRSSPPLPRYSMGNLATNVVIEAGNPKVSDLVEEIRGAINEFEDDTMRKFQGQNGGEAMWDHKQMITENSNGKKFSTYIVSCQCRSGFTDVDFGFGKPNWIYPFVGVIPAMKKHYFIVLVDHIDDTYEGNGIEAWLILDKRQMQNLESNSEFLAYATPIDRCC